MSPSELEQLELDQALLYEYRSEIGRLFGEVGGVKASTPREAWLKYEAEQGRAEAAEERAKALEAELNEALAKIERLKDLVEAATNTDSGCPYCKAALAYNESHYEDCSAFNPDGALKV